MATNEFSNSRDLRKRVMHLYKDGWQAPNIAYITKIKQGVVEQILRDNGIMM